MIIKKQTRLKTEQEKKAATKVIAETPAEKEEKIDLFDLDHIDFSQRQERRRGDRRRGYRRIDDRNLISRAQEEASTIKDSAAKEGYKAGLEKAQADIEEIKNSITNFLQAKQEVFEYIAPDILEISVDIARKIVKKEIQQDPELILATVLDVLKGISKDEARISIKTNPSQVEFLRENLPAITSQIGLEAKVNVVADETVEVGSCILYTSNGVVDATIDTQLEIIKEVLKGI